MKLNTYFRLITIGILIMSFLTSCKDEEGLQPSEGQLLFKLQSTDLASSSGRTAIDMTPKAIIMTLVGNGAETRKTLDLISFSGEYATNPISLSIGDYQITEFIVTNSDDEVIYVVPKKDSEFGNLVSQPLPISITINAEQVQTVAPQVVSVAGKSASQFGYIAFGIDVLPSFKITTMGIVDGVAEMITPRLVLTQASDTLLDYILEEAVNEVPYIDNGADLRLTLMEHGFARYSQLFSADSLSYYQNEPLLITFEMAFTLEMSPNNLGNISFELGITNPSVFNIDWGNNIDFDTLRGKQSGDTTRGEIVTPNRENFGYGNKFISITGDFENIKYFKNNTLINNDLNSNQNTLNFFHATYLTKLEVIELWHTKIPELDLSSCHKLELIYLYNNNELMNSVDFINLPLLREIVIQEENLQHINIIGCNQNLWLVLLNCINLTYPYVNDESEYFPPLIDFYLLDCNFSQSKLISLLTRIESAAINTQNPSASMHMAGNVLPYGQSLDIINNLRTNHGWRIDWD